MFLLLCKKSYLFFLSHGYTPPSSYWPCGLIYAQYNLLIVTSKCHYIKIKNLPLPKINKENKQRRMRNRVFKN